MTSDTDKDNVSTITGTTNINAAPAATSSNLLLQLRDILLMPAASFVAAFR